MVFRVSARWSPLVILTALLGAMQTTAAEPLPPLSAENIIKKVMERAQSPANADRRAQYGYTKRSVTKELDGKNAVKETKEKVFIVQSGVGYLQNMKINGKPVSEAEMNRQNQKVLDARQKLTGRKPPKSDDNWDQFINTDLAARYQFTLLGQQVVNGRPAYVLCFRPLRKDLPVKQLSDRLLNQLTGTVWVDGEEFEIAKADLYLQSQVDLGGIMEILGALKKFRYNVERVRVDALVWFNRSSHGEFEGRKFLSSTHVKTHSESTNFHKTAPQNAQNAPPRALVRGDRAVVAGP